jgi:hypothetical protein
VISSASLPLCTLLVCGWFARSPVCSAHGSARGVRLCAPVLATCSVRMWSPVYVTRFLLPQSLAQRAARLTSRTQPGSVRVMESVSASVRQSISQSVLWVFIDFSLGFRVYIYIYIYVYNLCVCVCVFLCVYYVCICVCMRVWFGNLWSLLTQHTQRSAWCTKRCVKAGHRGELEQWYVRWLNDDVWVCLGVCFLSVQLCRYVKNMCRNTCVHVSIGV